jgi:crotonobetainyl-CoA:carnitine CoA-transferase CaiB-like acyl-CoA transferase
MVVRVDDLEFGPVDQVAPALRFNGAYPQVRRAPAVGEHSPGYWRQPSSDASFWRPGGQPAGDPSQPPLAGVKILDLGAFYAGPYSSRLLADLGAEVVKVEPERGDQMRGIRAAFQSANAGKRSLALDLKSTEGERLGRRLAATADVIHHNLRPGVAERLGLGYEQVAVDRPDLVYLQSPGWGSSGPWRDRQSFAPNMSGYVGAAFESSGVHNPPLFPVGNEDSGNGLLGAVGILMALLARQRTGLGHLLENPQLHAAMVHVSYVMRQAGGEVIGAERLDAMQYGISPFERLYRTQDGWLCVSAGTEDERAALLDLVGHPGGADIERARRDPVARDELEAVVEPLLSDRSTADWLTLFAGRVPCAEPSNGGPSTFLEDPDALSSGQAGTYLQDGVRRVRGVHRLIDIAGSASVPFRPAPALGEANGDIPWRLTGSPSSTARP